MCRYQYTVVLEDINEKGIFEIKELLDQQAKALGEMEESAIEEISKIYIDKR